MPLVLALALMAQLGTPRILRAPRGVLLCFTSASLSYFFSITVTYSMFYISFRCTAQWLDIHTVYKVIPPISLVGTHLAPYIVIKILLTIFSMLYFTSP